MLRFNPITWNLVFRPLAGIILGSLYTGILYGLVLTVAYLAETDVAVPIPTWIAFGFVIACLGVLPEGGKPEEVPETRFYAIATFLGIPLGWLVRTTGTYPWTGKRLGLGRTTKTTEEFTDDEGFVKAGEIPFQVWNTAEKIDRNGDTVGDVIIKAPAKNRAEIRSTLTLILQPNHPRRFLDSDDPELDIGDRARQEFREMAGNFVDTDLQHLQQYTGRVLTGEKLVTCFLPKSIHGQKAGGMLLDNGGKVMFIMIKPELSQEEHDDQVKNFVADVLDRADPEMLKLVLKEDEDGNDTIKLDTVQIKAPIQEVTESLGFHLVRVTFGDIILSQPVTDAANAASSEMDERVVQIESARTNKEARKEMLPDSDELENPGWKDAMYIKAAEDNKNGSIKITIVPSDEPYVRAAVAGATQIGKG